MFEHEATGDSRFRSVPVRGAVTDDTLSSKLVAPEIRKTSYRPGGGETICPPPSRWQFDGDISFRRQSKIAADLRPSADGSAVRTFLVAGPAVAKLQAASVPIA